MLHTLRKAFGMRGLDQELQALREKCENLEQENSALRSESNFKKSKAPTPAVVGNATYKQEIEITDEYRSFFSEVLLKTSYSYVPSDQRDSESVKAELSAHVDGRFSIFDQLIIPWIKMIKPQMKELIAVEIGSGTGSSTLAFAPHVAKIYSFEIDSIASDAAEQRLNFFGLGNVEIRRELFSPSSHIVQSGEKVDLIILCAVLEHMSHSERQEALSTAWGLLASGGLLVVADTPNRFAVFDEHTSLLPFFSSLPPEIQSDYAKYSPRTDFAESIKNAESTEVLTRWGSGVSYQDFELAIGADVHNHIVLNGYESVLMGRYPDRIDDQLLRMAFDCYLPNANIAFTRHNLHLAIKKP